MPWETRINWRTAEAKASSHECRVSHPSASCAPLLYRLAMGATAPLPAITSIRRNAKIDAWLFDDWNPPHAGEGAVPEYIRRYLATYGEQCIQCRWATRRPKDGRIPLTFDHATLLADAYGSLNYQKSRRKRWGLHNARTKRPYETT